MTTLYRNALLAVLSFLVLCFATPIGAQDIWKAANEGDTKTLRQLLKDGQDVNAADPNFGFTPVASAVMGNQPKTVRFLAKNGADVQQGTADGNTPLHAAAFLGYDKVVKELLRAGANPAQANAQGQTPDMSAATDWQTTQYIASMLQLELVEDEVMAGREKAKELLLKAVDKLAKKDIWLAVTIGNEKYVKRLVGKADDLNALEESSRAPMITIAAVQGFTNIVEILLDAGANIDTQGDDGATALLVAAFFGREDTVRLLIDRGANQSLMNNDGTTPLVAAHADMALVDMIAGMMGLELNYDEVIAGKKAAVEMLSEG